MKMFLSVVIMAGFFYAASSADRYEAEAAIVDENAIEKVADAAASGGYYINMKEGTLSFSVNVSAAGYYTLWTSYSQPSDTNGKIQNLALNGVSVGQISFPKIDTFTYVKASSKIKLSAGANTIEIIKSWGWVNIDYIEITPYIATPFTVDQSLVSPHISKNANKMYRFIVENFQKRVISGVMTNTVMKNDGKYTPNTVEDQVEVAWVTAASGKIPALLGLDFMHAAGAKTEGEWFKGYTNATVALAEDIFKKGGIPVYCWHWKDPSHQTEAFYSPRAAGQTPTEFDLTKAFSDPATCTQVATESSEYKAIIRDIDIVAGYLKTLADRGVPVLWRPLHEASGRWFWWGYKGPVACKALYLLMFDRLTNYHKLDNLIWVWTTDEAGDALAWYPGDQYVDIIGRDYYYYPREANHSSLVASFEKLKEMFSGKKVIALSENGSIPFPDDMEADGAGWSFFMPWYGDYTMDGWAHDNTAADWKKILNSDYVLTLDEMPGWDTYEVSAGERRQPAREKSRTVRLINGAIECEVTGENYPIVLKLYGVDGALVGTLPTASSKNGVHRFNLRTIANGMYLVMAYAAGKAELVGQIVLR